MLKEMPLPISIDKVDKLPSKAMRVTLTFVFPRLQDGMKERFAGTSLWDLLCAISAHPISEQEEKKNV